METPTTVKVINLGNDKFSDELIAKFLVLGYDVIPVNCTNPAIINHRFAIIDNTIECHSEFVVTNDVVIFTVNHTGLLYVFLFDGEEIDEDDYETRQELCEFIIGTWGTIRGDRYKYGSHVIKMTEDVLDEWRIL